MRDEIKIAQFGKCKRAGSGQSYPAQEGGNFFQLFQLYLRESPIILALSSITHYRRAVEFVVHQHSRQTFFNLRNLKLGRGQPGLFLDNLIMLCSFSLGIWYFLV